MIPLQEFIQELQQQIYKVFPKEEYELNREIVNKVQETYEGIHIQRKGEDKSICVDLQNCYQMYLNNVPISKIVDSIINSFHEKDKYGNMEWLNEYSKVKNRLFLRVNHYDPINPKLKQVPYQLMEDIIMTYHVLIDEEKHGTCSCAITNKMLENYNVSLETFEQDAIKSAKKLFPILIDDFCGQKDPFFKILTNTKYHHGAATLFYPGIFQEIEKLGQGNFIIIPSSIHEVYIVKDTINWKFNEIDAMIRDCNQKHCKPKEILSDHGYYYDREYGKLESFQNYLKRKKLENICYNI